jgi:short-subunit dehydrogenase
VLAARTEEDLEDVARDVRRLGAEALIVPTDVCDRDQVCALAERVVDEYGCIDVWVNNAGGAFIAGVADSPQDDIDWLFRLNMMSVVHGVQAAVPIMRSQGRGHIINIASIAGRVAFPYLGVYSATKAFVDVLTQALRQELMHIEKSGILVSSVNPVAVRTPFFDKVPNEIEGRRGGYLVAPVLEPHAVGRAVADAIEHYRPVVLPFAPAKSLWLMYDLVPGIADRLLSLMRPDRPNAGPLTDDDRGSKQDKAPISPQVRDGKLQPTAVSPHGI